MIRRVLIANRGEIAVRIARTCREMGIHTIGVYSEADRHALHVECMDEAHEIGPAPSAQSYLRQDRLLDVARRTRAEAIHPGYGFLAENGEFAQRVLDAGLIWIGPPPAAIAAMGSKTEARAMMIKTGMPVVPGSDGPLESAAAAEQFAARAGYPVLIKAVAGGGGKGMRVVERAPELRAAFEAAQREALAAFGNGAVYAEKYIARPRHIEIQVFADQFGGAVYLGERECSIQRRHQKIIEESPSIAVDPVLRKRMGETAVKAALACGYVNAGTVETLLDESGEYFFLEMNTRLQVEHPVTEETTGFDLVRMQIEIAAGHPLSITQAAVRPRGHAIEVRVYAEDVPGGFLPSTGTLSRYRTAAGPGVRDDSGMREGAEVSRHYDPMIGKLIVRAENRDAAIARMRRVLEQTEIAGVRTNLPFCRHILESGSFQRGAFHTRSADTDYFDSFMQELRDPLPDEPLLAAALARLAASQSTTNHRPPQAATNPWAADGRLRAMRD